MAPKGASLLASRPLASFNGGPLLGIVPRRCYGSGYRKPATAFAIVHDRFAFTRQRRIKHGRFCSRTSSAVAMRRSHFVAPSLRLCPRRLGSLRKHPCIVHRPTIAGADGPEAAYHFLAPRRPAAQQDVGRLDRNEHAPCRTWNLSCNHCGSWLTRVRRGDGTGMRRDRSRRQRSSPRPVCGRRVEAPQSHSTCRRRYFVHRLCISQC